MKRKKDKISKIIAYIPNWLPTLLTIFAILWLTLAPHPLSDMTPPMFEGADKIVHALMFGGLTFITLFDYARFMQKHRTKRWVQTLICISCAMFGISIEYMQQAMQLGRTFDYADIVADLIGVLFFSVLWIMANRLYIRPDSHDCGKN